ncbi:MAG: hypothetical protein LAP85_13745 [Acidobacteriia bacterium]|nr:hypothetical protein [Terriglobia bacterium]
MFTYSVGQTLPADTKLVVTITDDTGKQVRRLDQIPSENRQAAPQELPKAAGAGAAAGAQIGRGRGGAPAVEPGRYTATLGKLTGDTLTPIGKPHSFMVVPLPAKNW